MKEKPPGLKVLFVSSEVSPFSKTGGLADVSGSLPLALHRLGVDVRVVTPRYKCVKTFGNEARLNDSVPVYFIENERYFMRDGLYGGKDGDYEDNFERFIFFSNSLLGMLKDIDFKPDIVHCNDWQTGLIPVYLKEIFGSDPFYKKIKTVFTVHNIGYQGIFPKEEFYKIGLSWDYFTMRGLEFYDAVNLLKGGLVFSDFITTVSPTYAKEIQTPEFAYGLEGVLLEKKDSLLGIINGIDYNEWNPSKDKELKFHFSATKLEGKYKNKLALQREMGLETDIDIPLIGIISRLADQKGLDLIAKIIRPVLKQGAQFIILGTGDEKYHILFDRMSGKFRKKVSVNLRFDALLAKKIYAGADMFLMPSRYEPCGLGQIISLRYGTIPIARKTGGLADTITAYDPVGFSGNGFIFERYASADLLKTISNALNMYKQKKVWAKLVSNAMRCDFSWDASAAKYLELYKEILR
ncbi:MAG: glycogen synthase GlgA [Candidatus Omnitrophota bacterium]